MKSGWIIIYQAHMNFQGKGCVGVNKKKNAICLASAILLGTTASIAAPFDLLNSEDSSKNYSFNEFLNSGKNFNYVVTNMKRYVITAPNGEFYSASEVSDAMNNGANDFTEAIKNLDPIEKPEPNPEAKEFKVIGIE